MWCFENFCLSDQGQFGGRWYRAKKTAFFSIAYTVLGGVGVVIVLFGDVGFGENLIYGICPRRDGQRLILRMFLKQHFGNAKQRLAGGGAVENDLSSEKVGYLGELLDCEPWPGRGQRLAVGDLQLSDGPRHGDSAKGFLWEYEQAVR